MLVFRELKENLLESSSLALGVFDGVHLGHQKVILNAVKKAQELGITNAVVTFAKHPRHVILKSHPRKNELQSSNAAASASSLRTFTPASHSMLSSLEERLELFENLGVQAAIVLDFDEKLASMTAKEYLEKVLTGSLNAKNITIGYNHKFGSDRQGGNKFLEEYSQKYGYEVNVISPVKIDNHIISSSVIRKFLLKGDVETAAKFLGRNFNVKGTIIHGQHLGRTLGFPTANLSLSDELIIPLNGVYSGLVKIDSKEYHAVINVGKRPTIGDLKKDLAEAHILEFDEDIYGKIIEVSFLKRIRDEKKFNSLEELKVQIKKDCDFVK
ncbi:MAG: riboflavin biosynthesis protein RibF [Candidatus Melainabacteria bacterium GWF2_32_7]|nr:MAG: riboflavin biosynthesis protein RibF [Candidatus Melainabacteria bacterium GWF2_32_7]